MSSEEAQKVTVMQGLKTVLSKMELAVARRSRVSNRNIFFTINFIVLIIQGGHILNILKHFMQA